jgi:DNA-directed RNA polymerase II subunit RPB1
MTLNTFKFAGSAEHDVTLGVPRLNEILNATYNPSTPACSIFLRDPRLEEYAKCISRNPSSDGETPKMQPVEARKEALRVLQDSRGLFEHLTVGMFITDHDLLVIRRKDGSLPEWSPVGFIPYGEYDHPWWAKMYVAHELADYEDVPISPVDWVVRLKIDLDKLYKRNITLKTLTRAISKGCTVLRCIPSPVNLGLIDVYIDFSMADTKPFVDLRTMSVCTDANINYFIARDATVKLLSTVYVQGVPDVIKVTPYEDTTSKIWHYRAKFHRPRKRTATSRANNFRDILAVDGVDTVKTVSNDMWEVVATLGIEAVRMFLIQELTSVISFDGTYINPRHIELLIDSMTYTGEIKSVRRDGIGRESGPIAKGMFEKATDNFAESAMFTEYDQINGLSAWVMYGINAELGSGAVKVEAVRDENM